MLKKILVPVALTWFFAVTPGQHTRVGFYFPFFFQDQADCQEAHDIMAGMNRQYTFGDCMEIPANPRQ